MRLFLFFLGITLVDNPRELRLSTPIGAEIAGTESHSYILALSPSLFVRVMLDQGETDLAISAYSPSGDRIALSDCWDRGFESLSFKAEQPGSYRIEVSGARDSTPRSSYTIELRELRDIKSGDQTRMDAEHLSTEARRLFRLRTADSLRQSGEKQRQSLVLWKNLGDFSTQAFSLMSLGEVQHALSDFSGALDYFSQALPIVRSIGDRHAEGECLSNAAAANSRLGFVGDAIGQLTLSLVIWKDLGFFFGEANGLSNLGALEWEVGEWDASLNHLFQARALIQTIGDQRGEAYVLSNIGRTYSFIDENDKALSYLKQALRLFRVVGDRQAAGRTQLRIAQIRFLIHEPEQSIVDASEALESIRAAGDRVSEADAITLVAQVHVESNEHAKAIIEFQQALALYRTIGGRRGEGAVLHNLGVTYAKHNEIDKARESLEQALQIRANSGLLESEAASHFQLARIDRKQERWEQARLHLNAAIDITERLRTRLGGEQLRSSYFASKQLYYQEYVDLLMQLHSRQRDQGLAEQAFESSEHARARVLIDLLGEDRSAIRRGADPALLDRTHQLHMRISALAQRQLQLLGQAGPPEREAAVRRQLESLLRQQQEVEAQIRATSTAYANLTQLHPVSLQDIQNEVLDDDTLLLQYSLGESHSYLFVVSRQGLLTYLLPARKEIEGAADQLYSLWSHLGGTNKTSSQTAATLTRMILEPAARVLGKNRLVVVSEGSLQRIPFAALPDPVSGQPLALGHEIVSLPSASTLAVSRREIAGRLAPTKLIAIFADPVFEADDPRVAERRLKERPVPAKPVTSLSLDSEGRLDQHRTWNLGQPISRLPFSRREADLILSLVSPKQRLLARDFEANKKVATDPELSQYRIVHFATHGVLDDKNPELSGIVLSMVDRNGRPQDGLIRVADVLNLDLRADLVVLSACQTGLGKDVKGEGLLSLSRGFMFAGAPRVIVSLWEVDDLATAELMHLFYKHMLGPQRLSPAGALRAAQKSIRSERRWQDPHYWAGFILQGEWR